MNVNASLLCFSVMMDFIGSDSPVLRSLARVLASLGTRA